MCKKLICITFIFVPLLLFICSCAKQAPNYLEYQSHSFTATGRLSCEGSTCDVTVNLGKENPQDSMYTRTGNITFSSPSELSNVTIEFSNDGTFISSGDIKIPIFISTLDIPNIISSFFSFDQGDIRGISTKSNDNEILDIIDVKKDLVSASIHINHETFLPQKIIADFNSSYIEFDISSIEFTDMEEHND